MLTAVQETDEYQTTFNVVGFFMLKNFWEYYVIKKPDKDGNMFAYVMGNEDEFGYVNLDELKPYIIQSLSEEQLSADPESSNCLAPPVGYHWQA